MFAAFPHWYATLFSGFYIPFVFMLLALIIRGVSFKFRAKIDNHKWKGFWDWGMFLGSLLPPILWGVAIANFMVGIPIDETKNAVGGFLQLLHPFAVLGGVMFLLLCIVHGLQFLTIRTTGKLRERARIAALKIAPLAIIALLFCRCRVMENRYFHWSWYRVDYGSNRSFCSVMCVNIIKTKEEEMVGLL